MPTGLYLLVLFLKLLDALADLLERLVDFGCGGEDSMAVSTGSLSCPERSCLSLCSFLADILVAAEDICLLQAMVRS